MSTSGGAIAVRRVVVSSPAEVCGFVDDLEVDTAGELLIGEGSSPIGSVFVEGRRICWVAARGLARRFTQLLVAHTGAAPEVVEQVVAGCIAERAPLGERLLAAGVVTAQQLRATLLQHSGESLSVACAEPAFGVFVPRRSRGYSSRFTFTTAEMLACALSHEAPEEAQRASAVLRATFEEGEVAAAFVRPAGRGAPLPVAIVGDGPLDAHGLLRLGSWATSALDAVADTGDLPFVASSRGSETHVAFSERRLVVGGITSELGAARILTRRTRALRAERRDPLGRL